MSPHTFDFLVVDDDADTRELMEILLTSLGHRVTLANDGRSVIELLHTQGRRFDLLAIDMQMPVMDGLEATRLLRAHPATRDLPILCISAKAGRATAEQCAQIGCDAFLTKPCWEEDILSAMSEVLRARGRLAEGEAL
jgi:CheY-like chemotaxis protein